MDTSMTATEARKNFFNMIQAAEKPGVSITITHEGHPKVIVMSFDEFEGWQETLEIMSDKQLMSDISKALKQKKTVDLDKIKKRLKI
jgi:antitoxin YefM